MNYALIAQCTYDDIQCALFQNGTLLQKVIEPKKTSSKNLLLTFDSLLKNNSITLDDLTYIGINRGPAPFTTLRVLIATLNGIAFARSIPMVEVSGLQALLNYQQNTIVIYNAFNQDVYTSYMSDATYHEQCENIDTLLNSLKKDYEDQTLTFIGQGVSMFASNIESTFGKNGTIDTEHDYPSLEKLFQLCDKKFSDGKTCQQVQPLYLKKAI